MRTHATHHHKKNVPMSRCIIKFYIDLYKWKKYKSNQIK